MAAMNTGNQYTPGVMQQTLPQPQVPSTYHPDPKNSTRRIPAVRYFGVFSLIAAFLLCCLGIAAIAIKAKDSYIGSPIWTALLFLLPTGALGLLSHWKTNTCSKAAYLVMNLLSCLICAHLMVHASINAVRENRWYSEWICEPQAGYTYIYYRWGSTDSADNGYDYEDFVCPFSPKARIAVDLLIMLIALVHFVVSIVSMAITCYGTCWCCYSCCRGCRGSPPPAVVQYTAQNGTCQLVSVGGNQIPAGYQQVSLLVPATQPAQPGQVTSPQTFPVVPGQYQPQTFIMPNSQTQMTPIPPNQMTMTPQNQMTAMPQHQMTALPQNQVTMMPQNQVTMMPQHPMTAMQQNQMPVIPQPFAPPTYQAADPLTSEQASNAVNSRHDGTGHTVPEPHDVAYGNTTTEQFHDKRNLLESV